MPDAKLFLTGLTGCATNNLQSTTQHDLRCGKSATKNPATPSLIMNQDLADPVSAPGPGQARPGSGLRALPDLALACAALSAFFALAAYVELSEKVARWSRGHEHWQADELQLTLLLLSAGLAWFALRRAGVARREIAERIRAEERITDLLAHNRELSQRLIQAQENERCALARELHDEVGQICTAIRAEASYIMHADDRPGMVAGAERIALASESLYTLVRHMLQRLRPAMLDSLGLEAALQELCESWEEQFGVACGFFPHDIPPELDDSSRITLFRLVQEALTNVARHAGADQVRIELHPGFDGNSLALIIEDNGCGLPGPAARQAGFGLIGMRERVAGQRGEIDFISTAGRGLRIEVALPLRQPAP